MKATALLSALLLAGAAAAQTPSYDCVVFHMGYAGTSASRSHPLTRIIDFNRDGKVQLANELVTYQTKFFPAKPSYTYVFLTDLCTHVENGRIVFYASQSGSTGGGANIIRSLDLDGDGVVQDGETKIWADFGNTTGSGYTPDSITSMVDYKGRLALVTGHDTAPRLGLYKSIDLNNDGDALDAGESVSWVDKATGLSLAGTAGPVPLTFDGVVRVRTNPAQEILVYNRGNTQNPGLDSNCWYALKEDATGKVTARNFLNASALNGLVRNVDFATGKIVDIDIQWGTAPNLENTCDLSMLAVSPKGFKGRDAYYFTVGYRRTGWGNKNKANQTVSGLVFRGVDNNNDGDLNDAGEVNLFFNGSGMDLPGGVIAQTVKATSYYCAISQNNINTVEFIKGIAVIDDVVYIEHLGPIGSTGDVSLLRIQDKNNNFKIETGEVEQLIGINSNYPAMWSNYSTGPYLHGIVAVKAYDLPEPTPTGIKPFGTPCVASTGLAPLAWTRGGAPTSANSKFEVLVSRAAPNLAGFLALGTSNTTLATIPLPFDLSFLGATGCSLGVNLTLLNPLTIGTNGVGSLVLPVPTDPGLKNSSLYGQFLLLDPQANGAGLVTTDGLKITIQ